MAGRNLTHHATQRLIFALDVPDLEGARELATQLVGRVGMFKIGLELYTAAGPEAVQMVRETGGEVFLDLKLHDIPATVARSVVAATRLGVKMLTVHASGGARMMASAVQSLREAAVDAEGPQPQIIAVTALTSLNARDLTQIGLGESAAAVVERLARLAGAAGVDGVVASPHEVEFLRQVLGPEATIVTPGVRPTWDERSSATGDDQSRVATPAEAIASGADYLVVGRPIREADDPSQAADRILEDISRGLKKRKQKGLREQPSDPGPDGLPA